MGRPCKLTPELQTAIVQALSVGATHRLACQYAGIHEDTLRDWVRKGEAVALIEDELGVAAGDNPFFQFSEAVKKAEGRAAVGWLAKIEQAANEGTWQAAAWKLERRYPDEYGKQVLEQHHSGSLELHETLLANALRKAEELRHGGSVADLAG